MQEREPEWGMIGPAWFHHHGKKMKLEEHNKKKVVIKGSAATVIIQRDLSGEPFQWLVDCEVIQTHPDKKSHTRILMSQLDLGQAFGLFDTIGHFGEWLIKKYGGTTANQGKFIRYQKFLNLPCPGTGNDGDPNVSVILDEKIKQAVHELIS